MIKRVYKYRAQPSKEQIVLLGGQLAFCCDLYNAVLELRRGAWKERGISLTHKQISKQLTELVREAPELIPKGMSRSMLQKTVERNNRAFQAFFRRLTRGERPGYPRYRSSRRYDTLASQYGKGYGVELLDTTDPGVRGAGGRTAYLAWRGVGVIKLKLHRALPERARISEVQIKRQADGWHVCLGVVIPRPASLPNTGRRVGIDLGITSFVAISDGQRDELIEGPRVRRKMQPRIARLQRELARKRDKRSERRQKAVLRLARARLKEARIRRDEHHKLARRLVTEADVIYLEDLNVKALADGDLAKDVRDQGWSQFRDILADKAVEAGRSLALVDSRGTSQECSGCGAIVRKPRGERTHSCPGCGLRVNRDVNAARVILRRGERQRETAAAVGPEAPTAEDRVTGTHVVPSTAWQQRRYPTCSILST